MYMPAVRKTDGGGWSCLTAGLGGCAMHPPAASSMCLCASHTLISVSAFAGSSEHTAKGTGLEDTTWERALLSFDFEADCDCAEQAGALTPAALCRFIARVRMTSSARASSSWRLWSTGSLPWRAWDPPRTPCLLLMAPCTSLRQRPTAMQPPADNGLMVSSPCSLRRSGEGCTEPGTEGCSMPKLLQGPKGFGCRHDQGADDWP